ncbi:Elongation factor G [Geodia barretti]|uniref:Elongation factor G n=1 Tax=Geodia barretti TaxID=519541 RepID=A0AA35T0I3_GEOBA|nr:Elongation factor G [Geodia barretti]
MDRDQGFQFGNEVVGGRVPREYIPSVEKGVVKAPDEGALAGYPIVDLKAVLSDGSFHSVDSSMSSVLRDCQHPGLEEGVSDASPILLEPVMRLSVTVPDGFTGEVMSDLNGKRGRILGMNPENRVTIIEAESGRLSRLRGDSRPEYLRSLTQGRGSYSEFDHYEPVPRLTCTWSARERS